MVSACNFHLNQPELDLGDCSVCLVDTGHPFQPELNWTWVTALYVCRLAEAGPLGKYITHETFPGPNAHTDADLEDYIRKTACSGNALVGTCK